MHSTVLEFLCTGLKCFLEGWDAFDRVGTPLYSVGMLYRVLECLLQSWKSCVHGRNAFQRVGIPIYGAGMLSTELEYPCTEL
jgi:hypothetical protein